MTTVMKKRSKRMENQHKDQLNINSSKLYETTSIKKAMKQMDPRTMHYSETLLRHCWKN
jgi:hypothetical protein